MSKTFKMRFGALCMALILALSLAVSASAAGSDFTIEDGVLTKYNGPDGDVVIPNSVTNIGGWAFYGCTGLTGVTISNNVTSIGTCAFRDCTGLTNVTIPDSVTSIESEAFSFCTSLTSVTIPSTITSIGDGAFIGCTNLTAIQVSSGNGTYSSEDGVVFNGGKSVLALYPTGRQGAYSIPESVTSIGGCAFYDCTGLTGVTIPGSVTSIEYGAFSSCTGLTSVTIPNGITSIEMGTFANCTSLTSVTIPNSVTSIGWAAFLGCPELKDVYYTGTEEQWNAIQIEEENGSLTSATIHYNSIGPDSSAQPQQPTLPTVVKIPATGTAVAKTQNVLVDGQAVEFQCYALQEANGGITNFVKLRDLAQILNGTAAQFAVDWDGTVRQVIIRAKESYTSNGSEGRTPFSGDRTYKADTTPVLFNGQNVPMTAFRLADDAGNGYTYYKLRDLGTLLNFHVDWSAERGVYIETDKPYQE